MLGLMELRDRLRSFISATFFVDDYPDEASFLQQGIIDSTGMMELVDFVEREFAISVRDEELVPENLDSIQNLVAFILRRQAEPGGGASGAPPPRS